MTVQQLIDILQAIKDKDTRIIRYDTEYVGEDIIRVKRALPWEFKQAKTEQDTAGHIYEIY